MRILVIDVGGTHVKVLATGHKKPVKIPAGPYMTAAKMVAAVRAATVTWKYHAVSIGYPGSVAHGSPVMEPYHLGQGSLFHSVFRNQESEHRKGVAQLARCHVERSETSQ